MLNNFILLKPWICFTKEESSYWFFISALSTIIKCTNQLPNYSIMLTLDNIKQHGQEIHICYWGNSIVAYGFSTNFSIWTKHFYV